MLIKTLKDYYIIMDIKDLSVTWLIYDKRSITTNQSMNGFSNELVKPYTITEILQCAQNDNVLCGQQAIKTTNELLRENNPIEQLDEKLYCVRTISHNKNNVKFVFTIIGINNNVFSDICTKNEKIPNSLFLSKLCRYNKCYENGGYDNKTNNIQTFIDHIMTKKINVDDLFVSDNDLSFVKTTLFVYQKKTIKWMMNRELDSKSMPNLQNDDIIFGKCVFNPSTQQITSSEKIPHICIKGGSLIDEMGLGKTIQTISLAMLNPLTDTNYLQNNRLKSRATLILCPNHLCGQWFREFGLMINEDHMPVVKKILTKVHFNTYTYQDVLDADFVILSYSFLNNKAFLSQWMPKISNSKNYHTLPSFDVSAVQAVIDRTRSDLISDPIKLLTQIRPNLFVIDWHRIIVDEFHEIYTCSKHLHMKNLIKMFNGTYKWCVTGTPFNKDEKCLLHMLDFLSHYEINRKNITFNDNIMRTISNECFRRNTKNGVKDEFVLPPIKEETIWLKFTPTERMMYNAFLANNNNDEYSQYLRQLCCHPNLATETKLALAECKTLKEIENTMVTHYKNEVDVSQKIVDKINFRIKKYDYKIRKYIYRKVKIEVCRITKVKYDEEDDEEELNENDDNELDANDEENENKYDINTLISPSVEDLHLCVNKKFSLIQLKNTSLENLVEIMINNVVLTGQHMTYDDLLDGKKKCLEKLIDAQEIVKGKETTYNFYKNAIEKVKKIIPTQGDENALDTMANQSNDNDNDICSICLGDIPDSEICITKCGHIFCYSCIQLIVSKQGACPFCKTKLIPKDLSIISYERKKASEKENPADKTKDELINEVGTKLANLILYLRENSIHTIIFSQWDDLLHKIGKLLTQNGVLNIFCRGNAYQKDKAIREFSTNDKIKVIMLSSDSAASGTNLTKAKQIVLLDPVYGTKEFRKNTEGQAIGRAHRLGQTEPIKVIRFIVKDSIEEKIHNQNIANDAVDITASDEDMKIAIALSLKEGNIKVNKKDDVDNDSDED